MANNFCFSSDKMRHFTEKTFKDIRAPFVCGIELTAKCNLKCVHCYAQNSRTHSDLSTSDVKNIIDILVDNNCIEVYFTGGEVFTRSDFMDIYIYAKKKGLVITVLSNITMLNEDHINVFKKYPVALISTTMYGYSEETYEKVTGIKGAFNRFINGIELLHKNDIPFEIKYVGMKQNIQDAHSIRAFGKKYGVNMVFGFDIRPTSDCNNVTVSYRVSPEEAFEFDKNDEDRRNFWISVARKDLQRPIDEQGKKIGERYCKGYLYPCQVAFHHVFITSNYMMQGCTKSSYLQYDLKNGDFRTGWDYLRDHMLLPKANQESKCRNCNLSLYCEHCTANSFLSFGNENEVDPFFCNVAYLRKQFAYKEALKQNSKSEN